jgi:outer membrane lipoprotein-sorting protein
MVKTSCQKIGFRLAAVFAGLLPLTAFGGGAADPNAVIDRWLGAQTNLSTWTADFVQTRTLKTLAQPLVTTGRVWYAKPDRFRWELGEPAQTIAVRNANQLEVIYPRLKRVERYSLVGGRLGPMREALGLLEAGFPRDRGDFDARFHLRSLEATNDAWRIELSPVSPEVRRMMPVIFVTVSKDGHLLLSNELVFRDGSRLRNDFKNTSTNALLSSGLFNPVLTNDFKISHPLKP